MTIRGLINHENYNLYKHKKFTTIFCFTPQSKRPSAISSPKSICKCFPVPHPRLDPLPEYPKHPLKIDRPVYVDCRRALPRQTPWGPADPWECPDVWIEPGDIENLGPIAVGCGGAIIICTVVEDILTGGAGVALMTHLVFILVKIDLRRFGILGTAR